MKYQILYTYNTGGSLEKLEKNWESSYIPKNIKENYNSIKMQLQTNGLSNLMKGLNIFLNKKNTFTNHVDK